jgi:hypothetical protein
MRGGYAYCMLQGRLPRRTSHAEWRRVCFGASAVDTGAGADSGGVEGHDDSPHPSQGMGCYCLQTSLARLFRSAVVRIWWMPRPEPTLTCLRCNYQPHPISPLPRSDSPTFTTPYALTLHGGT